MRYFIWPRYKFVKEKLHVVRSRRGSPRPDLKRSDRLLLYESQDGEDKSYKAVRAIVASVTVKGPIDARGKGNVGRAWHADWYPTHSSVPRKWLPLDRKALGVPLEFIRRVAPDFVPNFGRKEITAKQFDALEKELERRIELAAYSDAETEEAATSHLRKIAARRGKSLGQAAADLAALLARMPSSPRRRTSRTGTKYERDERLCSLLQWAYAGQCQVCRDTFVKTDGTLYSEVHHIDPDGPDAFWNLAVLCATCHRKMEYARVTGADRMLLTGSVTINGKTYRLALHGWHRDQASAQWQKRHGS